MISVQQLDENNFVAQMPAANVSASGDTMAEALENLDDMIAGTYELLSSQPPGGLSPSLARDLVVLEAWNKDADE